MISPILIFGESMVMVDYSERFVRFFRVVDGIRRPATGTRKQALDALRFLDVTHCGLLSLESRAHSFAWGVSQ